MKPVVAVVGRPNVGKSTFFNKVAGRRISIIEDTPGVTRDRIYVDAEWCGRDFTLIDTGGIEPGSDDVILEQMKAQAELAIDMADVIVFMVNVKDGMTAADKDVAAMLQKCGTPVILVANKVDNPGDPPMEIYEFYNLGIGDPWPVSSVHGLGVGDLLDEIVQYFPEDNENSDESDVIHVAIVGKPNAGKSSLLNLLIGENRAIVTDIAGTTRDILEEYITLHGISLKIIDTAGIRETKDIVEKIGVDRAREMAQKADLILYVVDSSVPLDENDEEIIEMLKDRKAIVLYNKTDLVSAVSMEALKEKINHPLIPISAKEETGIAQLADTIKSMFFSGKISFNDEVYITNARHKEALEEAEESLAMVKQSIEDGMPEDFFSIDLMAAYGSLGKITGEEVGEDLVNEIFSKFCMGK